jgi:succinoglycan biosynthesis transport protein ExoP
LAQAWQSGGRKYRYLRNHYLADEFDKADNELILRGAPTEMPPGRVHVAAPLQTPVTIVHPSGGLQEYGRMFRRHALFIAFISLGCALVGLSIAAVQPAAYRSQAALEVLSPNENLLNLNTLDPSASQGSPESYVDTQTKILQGDELIERAVLKLHLDRRPELFRETSLLDKLRLAKQPPASPPVPLTRDEMIERIKEGLAIHSSVQSRVVEVQFDWNDGEFAAEFPNTLANELIEQNLEGRYQSAQATAAWLAGPLKELKANLERSEAALQLYARDKGLVVNQEKGGTVTEARLRQVQDELSKAQADRATKQARYEIAASAPPESLADVLDYGPLRDTQARLTDLRRQLAELNATYAPTYFKVKNVQAQVVELETTLRREQGNILERILNDFQAAKRRESLLQLSYDTQAEHVSKEAGVAARYETLKSEVDVNRAIYGPVLQKVKEAGIASAIRASNIRVISHAKPPTHPFKPKPIYQAGSGLLAGLFMASAIILVREQTNRRIRFPGETSLDLNLAELGTIPSHSGKMIHRETKLVNLSATAGYFSFNRPKPGAGLIDWDRDVSGLAESLRSTLASLWFAGKKQRRMRVFIVTSPGAHEGKTTLVGQLGAALANTNRRVLLIDADLRRPRLHRMFDVDKRWGLGNILESDRPIEDYSFREMFLGTVVPGLHILPSGTGIGNVAGLRYQARLTEVMNRARLEFHAVLIDTPPVLQFADARILGTLADAAILVFRAGETSRDAAAAALHRLQEDGITVLGSILNDWNPKDTHYGYGAYDYGAYQDQRKS